MANPKTQESLTHPIAGLIQDRFQKYANDRQEYEAEWRLDYDSWRRIYSKPWKQAEGHDWRSQIFVGLTDVKVRIATASINDALMGFPFDLHPTPMPESAPGYRIPLEDARTRCARMKTRIEDQLEEMSAAEKMRHIVLSCVVYGTVFTTCPVLIPYRVRRYRGQYLGMDSRGQQLETWTRHVEEGKRLGFRILNLWDVFCDLNGSSPQDCEGIGDRRFYTPGELLRFTQQSSGFESRWVREIVQAAQHDDQDTPAGNATTGDRGPERDRISRRPGNIEVFQYWGRIEKRELDRMDQSAVRYLKDQYEPDEWKDAEDFEVGAVIARSDQRFGLIKLTRNWNDGWRPYQMARYREIPNTLLGEGLPRGMRDSQMMVNSLTRATVDNLAISAVAWGFIKSSAIEPWESNVIQPGLFKKLREGFQGRIQDILQVPGWPNYTAALQPMIQQFQQWASEESVPNLLGGQTEQEQPETAFATQKLWSGAHTLLGDPLRNLDAGVITPIVDEFYQYNMTDPAVPDAEKGDFTCRATGYKSFQDKQVRAGRLGQIMQVALKFQALGQMTKLRELYRAWVRTQDEDPDQILFSDEQMQKIMGRAQQEAMQEASMQDVAGGVPGYLAGPSGMAGQGQGGPA